MVRIAFVLLLALALFGRTAVGQDDEDYDEGGYGGDDEGYGGDEGGGGDEAPPPSGDMTELTSVEEFDAFLDNEDASVVAAFTAKEVVDPEAVLPEGWDAEEDGEWVAPTIENPALTSYSAITGSNYGYRYAYTTAPDVLAKLKSKAGGLYLYKSPQFLSVEHGDRPRERFPSDKLSESAVSNWLKAKAQPLVGLFSSSTSTRYEGAVLVIFMNYDLEKNAKGVNYVLKRARKAAVAFKGKLSIAVAKLADMSYELGDYGLESNKPQSDVLMGIKANKASGADYYGGTAAFSAAALSEFAQSYLDGKLTAHVKPDPPPYSGGDDDENYDGGENGDDYDEAPPYDDDEEAPKDEM